MASEPKVHDFSRVYWGHTIQPVSLAEKPEPEPDGSWKMWGCSTPRPVVGDIILDKYKNRWVVTKCKHERNPRDFFTCTLRAEETDDAEQAEEGVNAEASDGEGSRD